MIAFLKRRWAFLIFAQTCDIWVWTTYGPPEGWAPLIHQLFWRTP